jgi:hypothetical protein
VHHLRTFGCIAYVWNMTPHLKKLEECGRQVIFIGYESGSKEYRAYDPITKHVHVTRDVVFDEQDQWDWGTGDKDRELGSGDDVSTVEYTTIIQAALEIGVHEESVEQSQPPTADVEAKVNNYIDDVDHDDVVIDDDIDNDNLDVDYDDDMPLRFHHINDILEMIGFVSRALVAEEL